MEFYVGVFDGRGVCGGGLEEGVSRVLGVASETCGEAGCEEGFGGEGGEDGGEVDGEVEEEGEGGGGLAEEGEEELVI